MQKIRIFAAMYKADTIFLTGVGRSGTTVLQAMLDAHSEINFPPETHYFKRYVLPYLMSGRLPSLAELKEDPYLRRVEMNSLSELITGKIKNLEELLGVFVKIMGSGSDTTQFIGDKDTEYVRYLPHLKHLFPNTYLIHILRDPRDVVVSRTKTNWGSRRSLAFHAAEYEYYIKAVSRLGPMLFKNRYLEIRYEDLLDDPKAQLNRLLSELKLDFQPEMMDFHRTSSRLVSDSEADWKQNLSKPLMKGNRDKWKQSLTNRQAALIQRGIEKFMKANNYQMVSTKPTAAAVIQKELIKLLFTAKTFKERLR